MAELLLGKPVADALKADLADRVKALAASWRPPSIAAVRVGEKPDDIAYERSIVKAASELGILVEEHDLPGDISQESLLWHVGQVNESPLADGCIIFRPLPAHIDEAAVCNALLPEKDIDGIGADSLAGVFMGDAGCFAPATAQASIEMLDYYGIGLAGKHVAVVGRSLVVGKPAGMLALGRDATVTYCHSKTSGLREIMCAADIVICAVGRPRFFDASYFSEGQTVLDVGINFADDGAMCGDVDTESAMEVVSAITPVPRGVGSVSTAVLLKHVVEAAERSAQAHRG